MKYRYLLIGFLSTLALSCTVSEIDAPEGPGEDSSPKREVFYVSIDDQPGTETKVYADEDLRVRWNQYDRISIFNQSTFNREFQFMGKSGDNSGEIDPVGADAEGSPLDSIYAIYPYNENTSISKGVNGNGIVSFTLPDIQTYEPNSFGIEANTMISVTKDPDEILKFKNVGGYFAFKLYGEGVKVSSIILRGANGEPLAGPATIQMTNEGPKVDIDASTASSKIRLYCKEPVELGATPTVFWFVVPPVEFPNGFSVTVATPNNKTYTQSTSKPFTITRSAVTRLAPFEVIPTVPEDSDARITAVTSTRPVAKYDGTSDTREYEATFDSDTISILLPTVTDLSNNVALNYVHTGDKILVNGQEVHNGDVLKATGQKATLMVCNGDAERRYTLKVKNTGLPVVRITTTNFTREDIENDGEHKYWRGTKAKDDDGNVRDESALIRIDMPDGSPGMAIEGKPDKLVYEVDLQIKGRGNASWKYYKRPYALKLDKARKVLGMPSNKRWILLANWKDRTLLRNDAAFWLSKQTGLYYTVDGQYVELEFNGEHRGNYYLCEQIKIDKVIEGDDATGCYLMEIDNAYDEPLKFISDKFKLKYMFKDPDDRDKVSEDAEAEMIGYINNVENMIMNFGSTGVEDYKDYFDYESAIWFMFVNELTGNGDFFNDGGYQYYGPHSTNLYRDKNGILHMGPVWDFDYLTFTSAQSKKWVGATERYYYYNYLYRDSAFLSKIKSLWDKDRFSGLTNYINDMARLIKTSEGFNDKMWNPDRPGTDQNQNGDYYKSFDQAVSLMIGYFESKLNFMDDAITNDKSRNKLKYNQPGGRPSWWNEHGWENGIVN